MKEFALNQSQHSEKLSIPIPRTDLFKSSLVYSGTVLWNSLPDSLRSSTEFLNRVTCHTSCADCLALHVKFDDCNQPETYYHIVSTIHHAFTHQIMFANGDFIASTPIPASLVSCLTSKLHLFQCVPVCRSLEHVYICN